jgi:hypothetical protein
VSRLELEEAGHRRAETRLARLAEEVEEAERRRAEEGRRGEQAEERQRKLQTELRRVVEEHAALQVGRKNMPQCSTASQAREVEGREGRAVLEGRLEVALKEAEQVDLVRRLDALVVMFGNS